MAATTEDFPESLSELLQLVLESMHKTVDSFWENVDLLKTKAFELDRGSVAIVVALLAVVLAQAWSKIMRLTNSSKSRYLDSPGFPLPARLENFDWATTKPLQLRPFKPKYHLTMALETLNPDELIPMDKTYKERLQYRRRILREHPDIVTAIYNNDNADVAIDQPRIDAAISELYRYIMSTYLPVRYPTIFRLHETSFEGVGKTYMLENLVMKELYPSEVTRQNTPRRALEILCKTVDEDFLILLPEQPAEEGKGKANLGNTKYRLVAYETCYPAGFNPRNKLGKRLAQIHGPVPGYADKLERSMDRYFDGLEVGKYVKRVNWGISTDTELFAAFGGLHSTGGEKEKKIEEAELDVDSTLLRCERQTLHRLPKSKALVFGFHTYTYPISQIKEEGLGEELATAIDGLRDGSTPAIHEYKRGPVWGDAVKAYLRSEK